MTPDHINAAFEGGMSLLLLLNIHRLYVDKKLSGVSMWPTVFTSSWGAWNLYFYHHVGQIWSWYAGMAVFATNSAWVVLAVYYAIKNRK